MRGDNPSAFTTKSDEQFQKQTTPGRRKEDYSSANSPSTSPSLRKSPYRAFSSPRASQQKVITIFDQIVTWFHGEIDKRKRAAAVVCGWLSTIIFVLFVSLLKLSIWAPFGSVKDALTWWLYPSEWPLLVLITLISSAVALGVIFQFCKVDQLLRIPVTDTFAWSVAALEFVHRIVFVYAAFYLSESSFGSGFGSAAMSLAIGVSSVLAVFRNDFHLTFSTVPVNSVQSLVEFIKALPYPMLAKSCGVDTAIAFGASLILILFGGPIVWGFDAWWLLVNIPFHIVLGGICFTQQFYVKMFMKVVNQIVMKPMSFPFPPPYTVHSPTPEQTRTMPNVIDTDDALLKTFALHDLRGIAWNDETRRADIFSLSQPGKHPRNWKAVSTPCVRILDELCSRITVASARLVGYSWDDHDVDLEDVPRDAMLMPRRAREMAYPSGQKQRMLAQIRAQNTQVGGLLAKIRGVIGFTPSAKLAISRFDAQLNAYAAEALYMLVVDSLNEDRFGVVQKDLKDLISLLCKLIAALDNYERARASVADKSDVTFLRLVDTSLKSSLQRIVNTFGAHLRSLNLADEHICTIRLVCAVEEF